MVERTFGVMKRWWGFRRVRYRGLGAQRATALPVLHRAQRRLQFLIVSRPESAEGCVGMKNPSAIAFGKLPPSFWTQLQLEPFVFSPLCLTLDAG